MYLKIASYAHSSRCTHALINQLSRIKDPPLLSIGFDKIVLDELHLMLRISDVLLRNLIWGTIGQDLVDRHHSRPTVYLDQLVEAIKSCGVTFKVIRN